MLEKFSPVELAQAVRKGARTRIAAKSMWVQAVIVAEECGELVKALSSRLRERTVDNQELLGEMADVLIQIQIVADHYGVTDEEIAEAVKRKSEKFMAKFRRDFPPIRDGEAVVWGARLLSDVQQDGEANA